MLDPERIQLMTQMALHDKKYHKDKKVTEYYKSDYIYKKNAVNRIGVLCALGIILVLVILDMIYVKEIDVFAMDYKSFGIKCAVVLIIVLAVYTVLGTIKYGKEYDEAQKRTKKYFSMLSKLDRQKSDGHGRRESLDGGSDERDLSN